MLDLSILDTRVQENPVPLTVNGGAPRAHNQQGRSVETPPQKQHEEPLAGEEQEEMDQHLDQAAFLSESDLCVR